MDDVAGATFGLDLDGEGLGDDGQEAVEQAQLVDGGSRVDGLGDGTVAQRGEDAHVDHGSHVLGAHHCQNATQQRANLE